MQTIEIRHNNKRIIPMLILFAAGVIGGSCYMYFSGRFKITNTLIIFNLAAIVISVYSLYKPVIKIIKKEAILIFTKDFIEINDNKPVSYLWSQITGWEIEVEESAHYLIIRTTDSKRKVNISWLDKKPEEIRELMKAYNAPRISK